MRPSWDETWMAVASTFSRRSRCVRRSAASVIVSADNVLLAIGYNGPPRGFPTNGMCNNWCPRARGGGDTGNDYSNCLAVHGETNAFLRCDPERRKGGTIYVVDGTCCYECAKVISNSGLARAVMYPALPQDRTRSEISILMLTNSGVEVTILDRP